MNQNRFRQEPRPAGEPTPIRTPAKPDHDLEEVVARLTCYEPNSHAIEFTGEDLCRNSLFVGTVGSGKTTTMNPLLRDLIRYRAAEPQHRVGLLVIDSKMDDTVPRIGQWAEEAGRQQDLQILSPTSDYYYDFLADLNSFDQLDEVVDKILSATNWVESENGYWRHGRQPLLDAALTILLATSEELEFSQAMRFLRGWLMNPGAPADDIAQRLREFQQLVQEVEARVRDSEVNKLRHACDTINMWKGLDLRTKSNWTSVFTNCLGPFTSVNAQAYMERRNRRRIRLEEIVTEGKIVVLSINAAKDPELARLIGRLIKADFYHAAQSRQSAYADLGRLVGLVMDEYPLVVTGAEGRFGDIVQLQSLRSKRAFVVAATQGLISLDMAIGDRAREALLVNFNNLFLFNSHEEQVDHFARAHFGLAHRCVESSLEVEDSRAGASVTTDRRRSNFHARVEDWVCPLGRLSRLEANQAFVSLAGGRKFIEPLWIQPLYYEVPIAEAPVSNRQTRSAVDLFRRRRHARAKEPEQLKDGHGPAGESVPAPIGPESQEEYPPPTEDFAEPAEASPQPPGTAPLQPPCVITLTQDEFNSLWGQEGIIALHLAAFPQDGGEITIFEPNEQTAGEVTVALPQHCLSKLLQRKAANPVEKEFLKHLKAFLRQRERPS
jgi:hypothetical protein